MFLVYLLSLVKCFTPAFLKAALKMALLAGLDLSLFMLSIELGAENQRLIGPEEVNKRSLLPESPSRKL